jgi:hypothetical protein
MSGSIVSSGPSTIPLSGAQVCVAQTSNCSTTDGQGAFSLDIPANAQLAITIVRAGYTNVLVPIVTTTQDPDGWEIGTFLATETTANYANLGVTYPDSSTAFLAMFATTSNGQGGEAGVSFQLTPAASNGPFYIDATDDAGAAGTSTSTAGFAIAAYPSSVASTTIVYLPQTLSCSSNFGGWPAQGVNAVLVPLLAGFETHVGQGCFQ